MWTDRLSYRKIARLIGRNVRTVSRELRRNCTHMYDIPTYYPHTAQKKYLLCRSYCHRGMFHSQEVIDYIEKWLRAAWSSEQITCTPCRLKLPSWRTIYRWIYEKYPVNGNLKVLRCKGKSHGVKETRGKVDPQEGQAGIQPPEGRALGSRYIGERPGQKQSLLCHLGGAQDSVLHCCEDAGPTGGDHRKRHCRCIVRFPSAAGQDHYLRPGHGVCQLAPDGRTIALRGLFSRPVLCLAERHK